jgi:uroporphyrinogen-III decarboxylase
MTSQERWDALIAHEPTDRVPCLQFMLGHTAVVNGKPIAKIYDDAAESLACQKNAQALYGHDGLIMHGWANAGGAEFGGDIEFPYRKYTGAPLMKKNPVQSEEDAWNLAVPDDILSVGTMPI